jgi:Holliday junction DNA helicase RuvA
MIGSLRGRLLERSAGEVLVEVAGVGYRVVVSPATAVALGDISGEVFLSIHHHCREDAQVLYGFPARVERDCFEALLGAHGVGPGLAMAILSVHRPDALHRVLAEDDIAALCLVPGVGKKTAARLLIELKSRLQVPDVDLSLVSSGSPAAAEGTARVDVRDALANLGYGLDEIREVLLDLPDEGDAGVLLRQALQRLAPSRR